MLRKTHDAKIDALAKNAGQKIGELQAAIHAMRPLVLKVVDRLSKIRIGRKDSLPGKSYTMRLEFSLARFLTITDENERHAATVIVVRSVTDQVSIAMAEFLERELQRIAPVPIPPPPETQEVSKGKG